MNSKKQQPLKSEKTLAEIFKYEVADGVSEYHLMIHAIQPESTYEEQLNAIIDTYSVSYTHLTLPTTPYV